MTTHIADLKTFLSKIDAAIVVKGFDDLANLNKITDAKAAYVHKDIEIYEVKTLLKRTTFMYPIELRGTTDAILEGLLEALILNIYKVLVGTAIAGYTRPAQLCMLKLFPSAKIERTKVKKGIWSVELKLLMEWSQ